MDLIASPGALRTRRRRNEGVTSERGKCAGTRHARIPPREITSASPEGESLPLASPDRSASATKIRASSISARTRKRREHFREFSFSNGTRRFGLPKLSIIVDNRGFCDTPPSKRSLLSDLYFFSSRTFSSKLNIVTCLRIRNIFEISPCRISFRDGARALKCARRVN